MIQINRTNIAQEWAIKAHKEQVAPTAADVPKEYAHHHFRQPPLTTSLGLIVAPRKTILVRPQT
jgi:hypothetical protein